MSKQFTKQQLNDWKVYEEVRLEGRFNMFDQNARRLTGLSSDEYSFVMNNYTELRTAVESQTQHN